jgi:hypothetical protein
VVGNMFHVLDAMCGNTGAVQARLDERIASYDEARRNSAASGATRRRSTACA